MLQAINLPENVANRFWSSQRIRAAYLRRQALERAPHVDMPALWGDNPERLKIAREVAHIIAQICEWKTEAFIPEDPCKFLLYPLYDGLEVAEALVDLEDQYNIPTSFTDNIWTCTFGELVDYIVANPPSPEYLEALAKRQKASQWSVYFHFAVFILFIALYALENHVGDSLVRHFKLTRYAIILYTLIMIAANIVVNRRKKTKV